MFDLTGKVALVTGGANGIGQGIVKTIAKERVTDMLCDVDKESSEETDKEVGGEFHKLAITDKDIAEQVVQDILAKHDRIDILAANAGIYPEVFIEEMT